MAKTAAELEAHRDRLIDCIGKGTLEYSIGDRSMRFHTIEGLRAALAEIERQIARLQGGPVNQVRIKTSKGL